MSNTLDASSKTFIDNATTTALWLDQLGQIDQRPALEGDIDVDVAIVGGGFSGLWTAYYLQQLDPTIRIAVLEKHFCGYGASGRNGGWAEGGLAVGPEKYAQWSSMDAAMRLVHAMHDTVDEIGRVVDAEGISCGYAKGGWVQVARNGPQERRMREEWSDPDPGERLLEADEARTYLNATDVRCGSYSEHCAAVDPARLVRGLADTVEQRGVTIYEGTAAASVEPGVVRTDRGTVRAEFVVRATEAYTRDLIGERRALLPVYSLMVATEPLPEAMFDEIGLADRPTFNDARYMVIYGQRTEDNRLAFGGRGVPYLFGSSIDGGAETHEGSHALIRQTLIEMLPVLHDVEFTHRWGGVLGIPRDWVPSLRLDRTTGEGVLGGYVGEGVAAANLAGRTMAELIEGTPTDRTDLPWVGHTVRRWEPEPFRWLGHSRRRRRPGVRERQGREARLSHLQIP